MCPPVEYSMIIRSRGYYRGILRTVAEYQRWWRRQWWWHHEYSGDDDHHSQNDWWLQPRNVFDHYYTGIIWDMPHKSKQLNCMTLLWRPWHEVALHCIALHSNNQHTFMIWLHHRILHDLLDLPTRRICLLCLISDQKWAADHFPLLHLPLGIFSLNMAWHGMA